MGIYILRIMSLGYIKVAELLFFQKQDCFKKLMNVNKNGNRLRPRCCNHTLPICF